jgi:hypothetical protein
VVAVATGGGNSEKINAVVLPSILSTQHHLFSRSVGISTPGQRRLLLVAAASAAALAASALHPDAMEAAAALAEDGEDALRMGRMPWVREAKGTWAQPACTKAKRRWSVGNLLV